MDKSKTQLSHFHFLFQTHLSSFCQVCVSNRASPPWGVSILGLTRALAGLSLSLLLRTKVGISPEGDLGGQEGLQIPSIWKEKRAHYVNGYCCTEQATSNESLGTRGQKQRGKKGFLC